MYHQDCQQLTPLRLRLPLIKFVDTVYAKENTLLLHGKEGNIKTSYGNKYTLLLIAGFRYI